MLLPRLRSRPKLRYDLSHSNAHSCVPGQNYRVWTAVHFLDLIRGQFVLEGLVRSHFGLEGLIRGHFILDFLIRAQFGSGPQPGFQKLDFACLIDHSPYFWFIIFAGFRINSVIQFSTTLRWLNNSENVEIAVIPLNFYKKW